MHTVAYRNDLHRSCVFSHIVKLASYSENPTAQWKPAPHPHFPLERPDTDVKCVLYGRHFVLEKIVTSKGYVKGNTLCLGISGLCSFEACSCLVFVLSS